MTGGMLVLDAPVGPGPGEGMTGGTLVLLRPNHLPGELPPAPARVIVPRGTSRDVRGLGELEMDHQEVEDLASALGNLGVATPDKVADLLVVLVPEDQAALPAAEPAPGGRGTGGSGTGGKGTGGSGSGSEGDRRGVPGGGVTLEVVGPDAGRKGDASTRFADFSREMRDGEGD